MKKTSVIILLTVPLIFILYIFSYSFIIPIAEKFSFTKKASYCIYEPVELLRLYSENIWMFTESNSISTPPEKRYCLFSSRRYLIYRRGFKVRESYYKNALKNGVERFWYDDTGIKRIVANYDNGMKNGEYIEYHQNGNISIRSFYKNDILEGQTTTFYENGKKEYEAYFKNNEIDGLEKTWGKNGNLVAEGKFVKGKPFEGMFLIGNKIITYKNGEKISPLEKNLETLRGL